MRITSLRLVGIGPFEDTTIEFPKGENPDLADVYLLVGQNGCGKTTALHLLAALLAPEVTGFLRAERRFTDEASYAVAIGDGDDARWITARQDLGVTSEIAGLSRMVQAAVPSWGPPGGTNRSGAIGWLTWHGQFQRDQHPGLRSSGSPLTWAAFAYAGERSVREVSVRKIEELDTAPLAGSLGFHLASDSQRLAQWVANQEFKRLKALNAHQVARADAITDSVRRIEAAVGEVIGAEFSFHTEVDDLEVRAKVNGTVIEFGLLPAGVQSIVSWVADLLMRMDRVAWEDNLPVHEREFLLLLDEIDVHLHPAWQRKLLGVVQKTFPKAQVIASTHSPFLVASLADGAVIELRLDGKGHSVAQAPLKAPLEMSYSSTMRRLFGIESDFDLETETLFKQFQATSERVLRGDGSAQEELDGQARDLKGRGEEIAQLVQFELNQLQRRRPRPSGS